MICKRIVLYITFVCIQLNDHTSDLLVNSLKLILF